MRTTAINLTASQAETGDLDTWPAKAGHGESAEVKDGTGKDEMMKTIISVETEFGDSEFEGDTPQAADKVFKSHLRRIGLSIKKLQYYKEIEWGNVLHIFYGYMPATFRYEREKAAVL